MGNCQAIDAAALVVQHPSGKIERMYWPISASEVMRLNPGHYVSLIIPLPVSDQHQEEVENQEHNKTVRFTRVKLLRPNETLALGHAYRLVTTQEVVKVLRAKKYAKTKKQQLETLEKLQAGQQKQSSGCDEAEEGKSEKENINHATKHERHRPRTANAAAAAAAALRSKSWRPSLQSISEGVS
ncbi:PREDICTED: DUF4228 [Prunus dulcis]|uniref:PREDICTED: DUF4228 n=1 Tax=Prunus dulcis TaxID=3755 RepID=A0A5E4FE01_PRUDU|nr:uncharacterized protein LOC117621261 [Prunus dulcis]VVA26087.1 PREDICTED: DUF4228 [Prunus dulcis]